MFDNVPDTVRCPESPASPAKPIRVSVAPLAPRPLIPFRVDGVTCLALTHADAVRTVRGR